jgi:ferredoxin
MTPKKSGTFCKLPRFDLREQHPRIFYILDKSPFILHHLYTNLIRYISEMPDIEESHVLFKKSNVSAKWLAKERLSLLQLAEKAGLKPDFGCRSGACGTCETKLLKGTIEGCMDADDTVLICCSQPTSAEVELEL